MLTKPNAPFRFYDPHRPIFSHARYLPPVQINECTLTRASVAEGGYLSHATIEDSVIGIRTQVREGSRITRSVINGADYYESPDSLGNGVPIGIGRNCVLDRVIVDKNARIGDDVRLVNEKQVEEGEGPGYVIREGIIIVKNGETVPSGTCV
jgi:glucose-1-phosphate adenylyltransferase